MLEFEGYYGVLYIKMFLFYVFMEVVQVKVGMFYEGYYVLGKDMMEYIWEDCMEENKKFGMDIFVEGSVVWLKDGDMFMLKVIDVKYKLKLGIYYDCEKKIQYIEGVDVIFMGVYNEDNKLEFDDVQVILKIVFECKGFVDEGIEIILGGQIELGCDEKGKDQIED